MVSLMKNGIVTTDLFIALDTIRERHGVKDIEWADVIKIHPTTCRPDKAGEAHGYVPYSWVSNQINAAPIKSQITGSHDFA